jgi:transcriptional regulator with XRE-family HTH domain
MGQRGRFDRSELRAVGRRLRLRRVAKGWSLKRLSEVSSISVAAIRKVELGESNPSLLTILALVEALDEPVDRLIGEVLERGDSIHVVRAAERAGAQAKAPQNQALTGALSSDSMAGRLVRLVPGQHLPGTESPIFGFVLNGEVVVSRSGGPADTCRQGDAFHIFKPKRDVVRGASVGAHLIVVEDGSDA